MSSFYQEVYRLTREVPPGRVTTYGTIAALAGSPYMVEYTVYGFMAAAQIASEKGARSRVALRRARR